MVSSRRDLGLGLAALACAIAFLLSAGTAPAAAAPILRIDALSDTYTAPGATHIYYIQVTNNEFDPTDGTPITIVANLPDGITGVEALSLQEPIDCSSVSGEATITCMSNAVLNRGLSSTTFLLIAQVADSAQGTLSARFDASGGGATNVATTPDPVTVSTQPYGFGIDAFDFAFRSAEGGPFTQAAGHPAEGSNSVDFNVGGPPPGLTERTPLLALWPQEPVKDLEVALPPGILGNPSVADRCSAAELANGIQIYSRPLCPVDSQLGTLAIRIPSSTGGGFTQVGVPVYNMVPPPDAPALLGFVYFGTVVLLAVDVKSDGNFAAVARAKNVPEGLPVSGGQLSLWGDPASAEHDSERACPGELSPWLNGATCPSDAPSRPFLRMNTSCQAGSEFNQAIAVADSWEHPGAFHETASVIHAPPGYPLPAQEWGPPQPRTGCSAVRFNPHIAAELTSTAADSPTGLDLHLSVPQDCWEHLEEVCQSDLRAASVRLPQGMTLNPSAAGGTEACSSEQIGLTSPLGSSPVRFTDTAPTCPPAAKIGTVRIESPLLSVVDATGRTARDESGRAVPKPLTGSVYLAAQGDNPFGSLLGIYLVAEGSGVLVKQAGAITSDPDTGRLTTVFTDSPQVPFSDLQVKLFGGPRAPLRTPGACGTYALTAELTPWSGTGTVTRSAGFEIENCPRSGFDPGFTAGTANPLAGAYSPFHLRLTREDGTDPIAGLQVKLPRGLLANLGSVSYCSDAALAAISKDLGTGVGQVNSPACPAASQVGTVTVGVGAGPTPFYTDLGRLYWAGPYKGAPVSLAAVVPAVAGPFDLGTQVVRNGIHVDPDTAELTVKADPLPTILHGIPLDLRDVRVDVTRLNYTLNPTNCEPMSVEGLLSSTTGATAARSARFQVGGCDRLGFKPKLSFRFKGPVHRRAHPSLTAVYKARPGDANLARAQVKLPPAAFLDNAHIGQVCTRVQFAAHACPTGSVYGRASATSPILPYEVKGNVYLRSSSNKLPDLVADLRGPDTQPIEVALAGRTDSVKGALRNTFELVPDAPVTEFRLTLFGKKKGLIIMSSGFCNDPRATVKLDAQNGKVRDTNPVVRSKCGKSGAERPNRGQGAHRQVGR